MSVLDFYKKQKKNNRSVVDLKDFKMFLGWFIVS